jgi:hypothetical protein
LSRASCWISPGARGGLRHSIDSQVSRLRRSGDLFDALIKTVRSGGYVFTDGAANEAALAGSLAAG